ncbi:TRAF3-interacting protein 1 [Aedes aegypti]|uniref:TRAF3-interacting protein 1 n=1 Tax=Aedes aegypti TaxID=7159 RepID=A0A6I8T5Z8_AEDAE|nr:TRAF3-interacting protein 1 [Aedes aegypti]
MGDPDPAIIKKTQTLLRKYVKKPALTDKLLKKPPFRFLHDIINVVIKDTGFLSGLYTPDELISDNIKDRDAKIAYLQKLIDVTKSVTGQELKVRPSKVVAGLEADKTNELLQAIGTALDKKLDSSSAIQAYVKGTVAGTSNGNNEPITSNGVKPKDDKKKEEKKKEKDKEKVKDKETDKVKERDKDKDKVKIKDKERTKRGSDAVETKKEDTRIKKEKPEKASKTKEKDKTTSSNKVEKSKVSKPDTKSTNDRKKLEKQKSKEKEKPLKRSESIKEEPSSTNGKPSLNNIAESSMENDSKDSQKDTQEVPEANRKKSPATVEDELVAIIDEEAELRRAEKNSSRRSSLKKQGSLTHSENNALADLNQYNGLEIQGPSRQNSGIMGEPITRHDSDPVEPIASERISVKPPINRQQSVDSVMRPRTSLRPPSVRPPSARPGAPRRKEKNVEIVLQPNETTKLGEINVKMEVFNNELLDDDGENLIVIEDPTQAGDVYSGTPTDATEVKEEQEQGHLVQQILETQKEFSNIAGPEANVEVPKKPDNEWTTSQRQSSVKQMETLRESIQKLTRSVNPLGKLMDFIQEDIDSMERELTNWQQIYSRAVVDLNKERSANENAIEPLKHQLAQIETNIKEYRDMVDATRGNILQNEQKIERLYMTEI